MKNHPAPTGRYGVMNRRHLLRSSAFAGTASLLAPFAHACKASGLINVAVIGLRGRGGSHMNAALAHPNVRIVALCDVDAKVLAKAKANVEKKQKGKVTAFTDYRKVCEDKHIDAVLIATPNHTHTLISLTAAAQGKHVYVEKPVSHNIHEGRALANGQKNTRSSSPTDSKTAASRPGTTSSPGPGKVSSAN